MADNQFKETVGALFNGMEHFLSAKTVVGEPITINDTIIVPLVDVSFGVAAGAWSKNNTKESAGGGLGGKMRPSAVLIISKGNAKIVPVEANQTVVSKLIDMVPGIVDKFMENGNDPMDDPQVKETVENLNHPE